MFSVKCPESFSPKCGACYRSTSRSAKRSWKKAHPMVARRRSSRNRKPCGPDPAAGPPQRVQVAGDVSRGLLIRQVAPVYPDGARRVFALTLAFDRSISALFAGRASPLIGTAFLRSRDLRTGISTSRTTKTCCTKPATYSAICDSTASNCGTNTAPRLLNNRPESARKKIRCMEPRKIPKGKMISKGPSQPKLM